MRTIVRRRLLTAPGLRRLRFSNVLTIWPSSPAKPISRDWHQTWMRLPRCIRARPSIPSSGFFGPSFGLPEGPFTASAYCMLRPYQARRLGKTYMKARQVSRRGGGLICEGQGDRVGIGGQAVLYFEGRITVQKRSRLRGNWNWELLLVVQSVRRVISSK